MFYVRQFVHFTAKGLAKSILVASNGYEITFGSLADCNRLLEQQIKTIDIEIPIRMIVKHENMC